MRHSIYTAWGVALCALIAAAQPATRKDPYYYAGHGRPVQAQPAPGVRLGLHPARQLALGPLTARERAALAEPGTRLRTGVHRQLPAGGLSTGAWEVTSEGARIWRMAIHSPGSISIRLEFRKFDVGGGRVWLHDGRNSAGPYTGRGTFDDGHFWSGNLFSDSVTLEYEPAQDFAGDAPPFEIASISHQARAAAWDAPDAGRTDPADFCNLDPNCYAEWKPAMSMVGQLSFEDGGYQYFCSGALVATRDNSGKPYLLTAGHCINTEAVARTLEVFWTYQTSTCGGTPPASRDTSLKSSGGGHLIDWGVMEAGDYSLVLLQNIPSGVTFSGWDPNGPTIGGAVVGIHHPEGSWKRISFGTRTLDTTVSVEDSTAPGDKFYSVEWDRGRAEPGSSGSPLFSSPGVIVGMLSYGPVSPVLTACEIDPMVVGYGRFSSAYNALEPYFENLPAASVGPDKSNLRFVSSNHATPVGQAIKLTTQSTGTVSYKLRADASWIKLSSLTGTATSASPGQVTIAIDPSQFDRPDQYSGTVTILAGAADPQYINVTAVMTVDQSNVVATITPGTVVQSGGAWAFTIRLTETGGAATRITGLKFNTADYSSSIQPWFGTDRLAAKGVLEAPLTGSGPFPAGAQFFEFSGVDDASGQHWYRVATVNFQ